MAAVVEPVRVCITGAAGQIGYSLIPLVAGGSVLGPQQPVILHLLDIDVNRLRGVVMEIDDCAYPLVKGVVATSDLEAAFKGVKVAFLVGGFPRLKGMQRRDLMAKNVSIFVAQGQALNQHADPDVKVLVVANPANSNCLIASMNAPNIPKKNFTALTRLDQNRAKAQLANKVGVTSDKVGNVIIWGNHSKTQVPDLSHAYVAANGEKKAALEVVNDEKWAHGEFVTTVQERGAAVLEARGLSSAMSAANAAADHMRDWIKGTAEGEYVSMAVVTTGNEYGVPEGLVFSLPCTCSNGEYTVVHGLNWDEFSQSMIAVTTQELVEERAEALDIIATAPSQ
eukprot:TRINITY_DN305_c0_g1_i2.p2 TRINITY_DN305_c0_g1~~TRINITY_DN305_c0_g1_i2.p2  ORF type:complete len:339 (+),score=150.77 TRINITY_DN305_c0_g1_i2:81-1097(+)